jgi:hypothetical protein
LSSLHRCDDLVDKIATHKFGLVIVNRSLFKTVICKLSLFLPPASKIKVTQLLNIRSSSIELARCGYKLGSVTNEISIAPHKRCPRPLFIVRGGEWLIVYSLIVVGPYYKGSAHLAES